MSALVKLIEEGLEQHAKGDAALQTRREQDAALRAEGFSDREIEELLGDDAAQQRSSRTARTAFRASLRRRLHRRSSDRFVRVARITLLAERVFGDSGKARLWLRRTNRALNGQTPLSLLKSETGALAVENLLHRIDHGIFA